MAKVRSSWKFTFDPSGTARVLVAFNDLIDSELVWSLRRNLMVTQLDEASAPFLRAGGNAVVSFNLKVYTDESLDATARRELLESLIAVAPLVKKPLKVEVAGISPTYWQFANSFITEHTPVREMDSSRARLCRAYSITATGLVRVGV